MNDSTIQETREARYGKTERKHLSLTSEAVTAIQVYAEKHNLYFSVAIEALALMSLGNDTAEALPRLVNNLLERALARQFNRFAKLLTQLVIETHEVNYKVDALLLQTIWREARLDPDNFLNNLLVSDDPAEQPAGLARQIRDGVCADAHQEAIGQLKKTLKNHGRFWEGEGADES